MEIINVLPLILLLLILSSGIAAEELDSLILKLGEEDFDVRSQWKVGHIHSHNVMRVFFSGTDMDELHDNAPSHNFYVSLIVNNLLTLYINESVLKESFSHVLITLIIKSFSESFLSSCVFLFGGTS